MKALLSIIIAASAAIAYGASCTAQGKAKDARSINVKDTVDIRRTVSSFNAVELSAVANVVYTQGDKPSMRIVGTRKLADNLSATVEGGTLVLAPKEKVAYNNFVLSGDESNGSKHSYLVVYVTSPSVERVSVSSVGSFVSNGTLKGDDMNIKLSGVGSVKLRKVECKRFAVDLSGVGSVESADVSAEAVNINSRGAGSLKLTLKGAEYVNVAQSGVGNTNVRFVGCGTTRCTLGGVGTMKLSGTVRSLQKSKGGFGTLNTDGLAVGE